jgi:hypothetical protein
VEKLKKFLLQNDKHGPESQRVSITGGNKLFCNKHGLGPEKYNKN